MVCVVHHDDSIIDQVSWSSMSAQQHRIEERVDAEDLARQVRAQDDRIAQLRQELQEQVSRLLLLGHHLGGAALTLLRWW